MSTPTWLVAATPYLSALNDAEATYHIPHNLLARIAWQESHFRPDIIAGAVKSPAGAVGIMQLMPNYFPDAGQSVLADINTAARLLTTLFQRFKDWQLAVAAYNWGGGNVHHEMADDGGIAGMPTETQNYVNEVFADVPVAGSLVEAA